MPFSRRIHNHALLKRLYAYRLVNVTTDDQFGLKLEHVFLQGKATDVLSEFRSVQAVEWRSMRNDDVVIPEFKRTRVC
jgi:hypothetical protein